MVNGMANRETSELGGEGVCFNLPRRPNLLGVHSSVECIFGLCVISRRVMMPTSSVARFMGGGWMLSAAVLCLFKSPLKNVATLRGKHTFAFSVYVADASYCIKVNVKVYAGSHQRALRKGSKLVLTQARSPTITKNEKEKQQRLMRIRRVVSHAIRPASSPPEASRSTRTSPSNPPLLLLFLRCILCLVFVILFKLFIAWQCSLVASWCTLCVGTPKFSRGVTVY